MENAVKKLWMILLALGLTVPLLAASELQEDFPVPEVAQASDTLDHIANKADWRFTRDLQVRLQGTPTLGPEPGPTAEMLLAAVDLGGFAAVSGGGLGSRDYDALYSLLQRYRDELMKMGLDHDQLMTQLKTLNEQAGDLQARLDKLHPLDGLKIHGKLTSYFDDLHIIGNRALSGPSGSKPKPAGDGIRFQTGLTRADLEFTFNRGLFTGLAEFDLLSAWGTSNRTKSGARRVYMEYRSPIVIQFGDLDVNQTRLTLWRNEDDRQFEPEPFKSRRERVLEDHDLLPNKWRLRGVRISTDVRLFGMMTLELSDFIALLGSDNIGSFNPANLSQGLYRTAKDWIYWVENTTYMNTWRVAIPTSMGLTLSYNGNLFFDVINTSPANIPPRDPMKEIVHTARAEFKKGMFFADFEFAKASLTPSRVTYAAGIIDPVSGEFPQAKPITGTAFIAEMGIQGKWGYIKVFGGQTSKTFSSAGAQGRTQDNGGQQWAGPNSASLGGGFSFLGPFETDAAQIGVNGETGVGSLDPAIPLSFHTRYNTQLLPPGFLMRDPGTGIDSRSAAFQNLLTYNFLNDAMPYGAATPNRKGFGLGSEFDLFGGVLRPKIGYQVYRNVTQVAATFGTDPTLPPQTVTEAFTFTKIQVGGDLNFKLGWPVKLTGGYTMNSTTNGENTGLYDVDGQIVPYALNSALLDAGLQLFPTERLMLAVGYRHVNASGISNVHLVSQQKGIVYDMLGYAIIWNITDSARLDLMYENEYFSAPEMVASEYEQDSIHARVTIRF